MRHKRIFKVISRRLRTNSISLELWKAQVVSYSFCSVKQPPWRCWLELFVTQYWTLLMSLHFISVDSWWLNETPQFHRTRFTHASAQLYVLPYELDGTCLPSGFLWKGQFCRKKINYLWWVNLPDISLDITEWKCDYAFITWHSKRDQHYPHKEWTYEIITASFFLEVPGVIFSISCKALCFDRLLPLRNKYSKWLNLTGSPRTSDNNVALAHFTMFANEGQCKRLQSWAVWFIAHETFPQFG